MFQITQKLNEEKATTASVGALYVIKIYWSKVKRHWITGSLILFGVIVASIAGLWTPLFYKDFFDVLSLDTPKSTRVSELLSIILMVLGLNLISWLGWRVSSFANSHFQPMVMADLKRHSFEYLLDHSYTFFANSFAGSLVQKVNRLARSFERLADRVYWTMIPLLINVIGALIVLSFINKTITFVLLGWIILFLLFNYGFARWKLKYDVAGAAADSQTTAVLADIISNQNTVQLFTGKILERKRFKGVVMAFAKLQRFRWNLDSIVEAGQALLVVLMEFLLFYYALNYWQMGVFTVGVFVLIQAYFIDIVHKIWDFSRVIRDVYESFADAKEMAEILATPHEIRDVPGATILKVNGGSIEFKDLLFSFNSTRIVLNKVNLTIAGGEKIALIGPSGAGKSTFFRLLLRFYEPTGGKILIDGQNTQQVTQESLRRNISLVPQDPLLFHRSLLENIRYGRPDATDEEVKKAAALAHCDEIAENLPHGYDTFVGERGVKLSGGERQRVAIARAILKNAPILLLDEATSSLDSHSESLIQKALERLMEGKTTLVIAHRLSTIRKMDRMLVLEGGLIRESGTHDELLAKPDSLYAKLWHLQSGGFITDKEEISTEEGLKGESKEDF